MVSKRNRKLYPRYSALQHGEKAFLPPNTIIHLPCHTQREPLPQAAHQHFPIMFLKREDRGSGNHDSSSFPFRTKIHIILVIEAISWLFLSNLSSPATIGQR